jgi:hypothetical protein
MSASTSPRADADAAAYKRAGRARMLVAAEGFTAHRPVQLVDVDGLAALLDVAEAYESMVIEIAEPDAQTFLVSHGDDLFRYVIGSPTVERPTLAWTPPTRTAPTRTAAARPKTAAT